MDAQVDELQALVRQSREEQAAISSKILALKGGGMGSSTPGLRPPGGLGAAGGATDEVRALREQLSEADTVALEKDAEIEALKGQVKVLKTALDEPANGAAWRARYEDAQKRCEAWEKDYQGLQIESDMKQREIVNLSSYLRILEVDQQVNGQQRERLLSDGKTVRGNVRVLQVERDSLGRQLRALEEGFLRCIGRVTQSLASGVSTVIVDDQNPEARFVVLRAGAEGVGVIEIFREPDAHDEILALELSKADGAAASMDEESNMILLTSSLGESTLRLCCVGVDEFMKWSGALRQVGFEMTDA